jgi:hypothetical protein
MDCGRFVGRDGSIEVEYFEMSSTVASVEGTCARCIAADATSRAKQAALDELSQLAQDTGDPDYNPSRRPDGESA